MSDLNAHLPEDIAAEKHTAAYLRENYKGRLLASIRNFRALRLQAPGVIAEFLLGALIAITTLLVLFHDLNVVGLIPVVVFCIKFVLIIAVCFWIAGKLWIAVGLTARDKSRYVVRNFWALAGIAMVVASIVVSVFFPDLKKKDPGTQASALAIEATEVVQVDEFVESQSHEQPPLDRVFEGRGWRILRNADFSYATALIKKAPGRCEALGDHWILADQRDFVDLEEELKEGGHVGSFWTASGKPNSNLDYFLTEDGSSRFRWALSGKDSKRIVLCVMVVPI